ncbi:MAG: DUF86 domain-containing protein [bacterium]|nr:DUF86 domain-containing protein [bacterium]
MTNLSVIENKITSVKKYLGILQNFKKYSRKQIEDDLNIRGAVERYLYLAAQAAIDTAEAFISLKNLRKPTTIKEGFEILEEEKIISIELRERMVKLAGFRNFIAHDYEKINYDIVYDVLQNKLQDIEKFLSQIEKKLNLR